MEINIVDWQVDSGILRKDSTLIYEAVMVITLDSPTKILGSERLMLYYGVTLGSNCLVQNILETSFKEDKASMKLLESGFDTDISKIV